MWKRHRMKILFVFAGAVAGYLVLHPYVMLVDSLMQARQEAGSSVRLDGPEPRVHPAFHPSMLPMAIPFVFFGSLIGIMTGAAIDRSRRLHALELEREKSETALETVKSLVETLSHHLLNANMIIGGKLRHCRRSTTDSDLLASLDIIEEQGRKIDAVIGALRKASEIRLVKDLGGRITVLDISEEIEALLGVKAHGEEKDEDL